MRQINSLGFLMKHVSLKHEHKPSLPAPQATPKPELSKVASNPVRTPVNRQTARVIAPVRCWTEQPLPDAPQKIDPKAFAQLQADLKTERNAHAATRDELGFRRAEVRNLRDLFLKMSEERDKLVELNRQQEETIRQLEDLKL